MITLRTIFTCSIVAVVMGAGLGHAADGVYTNNGSGNWSNADNWRDGIVADGAGSMALIDASIGVNTFVVTLDSSREVGTLGFSDASSQNNDWTLSDGGNATRILTMTNAGPAVPVLLVSNRIVYVDVTLAGGQGLVFDVDGSGNRYAYLRRTNSYTGITTIRRGEVLASTNSLAGEPGAFGQDTSTILIGDAQTLETDVLGIRAGPNATIGRNIQVNDAGSVVYIGAYDSASGPRYYTGDILLNRDVVMGNFVHDVRLSGLISGPGGILAGGPNASQANQVSLYATNSFTGPVVLSRGNLNIYTNVVPNENGALGNATSTVVLGDAATGNLNVGLFVKPGLTFGRNIWVQDTGGSGLATIGCAVSAAGVIDYSGDIRTDRRLTLNTYSSSYKPTFSGIISGTGDVALAGSGWLLLNNTNTFTGDFYHTAGNGQLHIGLDVLPGQPSPLGNSTNPIYVTVGGTIAHYIYATNTLLFARNIAIATNVKTQISAFKAYTRPEFNGDIDFEGDLILHAADRGELLVSGMLTTATNSLSINGVSSMGNHIYLSNPSNQLTGTVAINQAARLVVQNSLALNGATQILYGATGGVNPSGLYADDGVTVTQAVYMPGSPYNAGVVEIGMRTNGVGIFTGPVNLTRTNSNKIFSFTAPTNGIARFTGAIDGVFNMRKTGIGTVSFEGVNDYTNDTEVYGGTLSAVDGQGLPAASRLILNGVTGGGVFESSGTFTRNLGIGPGEVFWFTNVNTGLGGFSARGGKLTVDLNNNGPDDLIWGQTFGFVSNAVQQLRFGSPFADSEVEFVENIGMQAPQYHNIYVYDNPATRSDKATLSGVISGSVLFYKRGPGVLALNATNTLTANITCFEGTLLVNGELPAAANTLTVYSNAFLGGSGVIRTKTIAMNAGSGFDWGDAPGTLTITNSFAFPANGVFRFVIGPSGTPRVASENTLTLPANATVEIVPLGGAAPLNTVILTSANTVGDPSGWTLANNSLDYSIHQAGNDIILRRSVKGSLMIVR